MDLTRILHDDVLPLVDKPSRYLGNEVNAVHKPAEDVDVRMALAFPDLYDLGLGNLGIHILYAAVNALPWACCERIYAPAHDMEEQLRNRGLPLFTLESKSPAAEMDLIGFTLQSELTYTNILNLLDLAGLSLRTCDRREDDPLTCAGGPAVFNPEPLAPFIDFFVIGDGEDAILEIAQLLKRTAGSSRADKLAALAELEGVYVPALYPMETMPDGRVLPPLDGPKIRKRITKDLNGATFPVDYIVPYTQQVHDRISLEVLRGCTQGCRFCQAGMTTRPVRERDLENVDDLLQRTLDTTGYEEVSLVSLSTCDYSRVRQLVENTVERARPQRVSVSLPSLRLDSFSVELADMVAETRRTGLTVAPEAASPRLRAVINKWIPDEELLEMTLGAYQRGWDHVKMYFMIGLPTERDDDVLAIADLAKRAVKRGREIHGRAKANLGVSTFVPKPFTPFQWAAQIGLSETERRQDVLQEALGRDSRIKFGRHDPQETFLEGLVSRSDRRAGDLIEAAFRQGARFDAWREHLDFAAWERAIDEIGFDVADALRERDLEERLPWDHIDILVDKEWFVEDWKRALVLQHAPDCRHSKCHKCGVIDHERPLCASMLRRSIKGRTPESEWERKTSEPHVEPPPVQRLWLKVSRTGTGRYLAHLEAMNAWLRALRRAKVPLSYSQGFHPHPKLAFSSAMPLNSQSLGEYMDITLVKRVEPERLFAELAGVLPEGFGVHGVGEVPLKAPSLMSINVGADYVVHLPGQSHQEVETRMAELLASERIEVARRTKKRRRRNQDPNRIVDIRPSVRHASVSEGEAGTPSVSIRIVKVDGIAAKVRELLPLLTEEPSRAVVVRQDTLMSDGQADVRPICSGWAGSEAERGERAPATPR
ncbi:MAG: TIGR03960 family B12-binding radical SAM protein [Myxococcales bacterium]|nr:TIGR03960 family B12-binding radical SAM protein [Myxococcales bacterium]